MKKAAAALAMVLALAGVARAQEGGLDILDGETLWANGGQLTLSEIYRQSSHLYSGSHRVDDALDRSLWESRTTLGINYGVLPELELSLLVPWVHREFRWDGPSEISDGVGDVTFLAKYRIWKKDWDLGSFNWTFFAGVEFPTGVTDARDGGDRLAPELQPGSGSWDVIVATAATFEIDRFKLNGVVLYERNSPGAQSFKFGDLLVVELTPGYRLIVEKFPGPLLRVDLGLQWRHEFAAEQDGDRLDDSGGDTFLVKPGVVFWPRPWLGFVLNAELPVVRDLRGEQLGLDFGVFFSVSIRF